MALERGHVLGTFSTKLFLSLTAAVWMYWMRIPHAVVLLIAMQGLDLFTGSIVAVILGGWGNFKVRTFGKGILLKAIAFPLLAACDLAEEPLHLGFHLDAYVALALVAYEFLSVVENYAKVRPLPKIVQVAAHKAQEWLSVDFTETQTVETVVKTVEIQPSKAAPFPPATIVTTVTKETHIEPIKPVSE